MFYYSTGEGAGALLLDAGLLTILALATGTGFVLGQRLLRSRSSSSSSSSSSKASGKRRKSARDVDRNKPESKLAQEQPYEPEVPAGSSEVVAMPPSKDVVSVAGDKVIATPTTDAGSVAGEQAIATPTTEASSVAGDKSPCTPTTERDPMADAKELARALARERRAAASAEAAAVSAGSVFMEALGLEQKSLHAQVRALAREAFSDAAVQSHKGEKVAALVYGEEVVGYASYQLRPQLGSLNINKLAVSSARRRQGLGRLLLRHLIQLAKRPAQKSGRGGSKGPAPLEVVCLSALPTAISFYKACGFKEEPGVKLPTDDDEELEEGQVYMEYRLRRKGKK